MTRLDWQFINTFAPWLSAIGTLSAVVLSLWLATWRRRTRLRVTVEVVFILEANTRGEYADTNEDYISFRIVNTGETEAMITTIGWQGRKTFRKVAALQNLDEGRYAVTKLPVRLKFGEETTFLIRVQTHWLKKMAEGMFGRFPRLSARALRAVVWTSLGEAYKVAPSKEITKRLLASARGLPQPKRKVARVINRPEDDRDPE